MGRPSNKVKKSCAICGTLFWVHPSDAKKYVSCSRECGLIRRSRLKTRLTHGLSNTPEMRRSYVWRCKLRQKYNLTPEQWEAIFNAQERRCAACHSLDPRGGTGWHTDHNHKTKTVRGILCSKCNLALGLVDDSIEILRGLIQYMEATNGSTEDIKNTQNPCV